MYKLNLIFLILIIFGVGNALAQENADTYSLSPKKLISEIGIFGGINHSWWSSNTGTSDRVKNISFSYGITAYYNITDRVKAKANLSFERKGVTRDYESTYYDDPDNPSVPSDYRFVLGHDLDYYTLYILPTYSLNKKKNLSFSVGGSIGYLHKVKTWTETYTNGIYIGYYWADNIDSFIRYDVSLSFGLEYSLPVKGRLKLNGQILYSMGLIDIIDRSKPNIPQDEYLRNNNISILIGCSLKQNNMKRIRNTLVSHYRFVIFLLMTVSIYQNL